MEDKVEISLKFGRQMMTQILSRIKYSSRNVKSQYWEPLFISYFLFPYLLSPVIHIPYDLKYDTIKKICDHG